MFRYEKPLQQFGKHCVSREPEPQDDSWQRRLMFTLEPWVKVEGVRSAHDWQEWSQSCFRVTPRPPLKVFIHPTGDESNTGSKLNNTQRLLTLKTPYSSDYLKYPTYSQLFSNWYSARYSNCIYYSFCHGIDNCSVHYSLTMSHSAPPTWPSTWKVLPVLEDPSALPPICLASSGPCFWGGWIWCHIA